jgi:hypothetical protein
MAGGISCNISTVKRQPAKGDLGENWNRGGGVVAKAADNMA